MQTRSQTRAVAAQAAQASTSGSTPVNANTRAHTPTPEYFQQVLRKEYPSRQERAVDDAARRRLLSRQELELVRQEHTMERIREEELEREQLLLARRRLLNFCPNCASHIDRVLMCARHAARDLQMEQQVAEAFARYSRQARHCRFVAKDVLQAADVRFRGLTQSRRQRSGT